MAMIKSWLTEALSSKLTSTLNVELNVPSFLGGRFQLNETEVKES